MPALLVREDWSAFTTIADLADTYTPTGDAALSFDGTETFDGHKSLKFTATGASVGATLSRAIAGSTTKGVTRIWTAVAWKPAAGSYAGTFPGGGTHRIGVGVDLTNADWTAEAGFLGSDGSALATEAGLVGASTTRHAGNENGATESLDATAYGALGWVWSLSLLEHWPATDLTPDARMRVRTWRATTRNAAGVVTDAVLVADQRLDPAVGTLAEWTTVALCLDPTLYGEANDLWVGTWEVWDAHRHSDPFGIGFLFADGMGVYGFSQTPFYEWGVAFPEIRNDSTARTGPCYWHFERAESAFGNDQWLGKRLRPIAVDDDLTYCPEVTVHLAVRPTTIPEMGFALCGWAILVPSFKNGPGSVETIMMLVLRPDGKLELRDSVEGVVATSPGTLPLVTAPYRPSQFTVLDATLHCHDTNGWLRVVVNGEDWWLVEGIDTDPNGEVPGYSDVTFGQVVALPGYGDSAVDLQGPVVTAGIRYPLVAVEAMPPMADGSDADGNIINWGIQTTPTPEAWQALYQGLIYEPDEDFTGVALVSGESRSLVPSPLPNGLCDGAIIGLVPTLDARIDGIEVHDAPATVYLRVGGTRVDLTEPHLWNTPFPGVTAYPGADGFQTKADRLFPVHPTRRDQLVAGDWGTLEYGVARDADDLTVSSYVLQALVIPVTSESTTSGITSRRNLAWRTGVPTVRANLADRTPLRAWVRKNLAWREIPLDTDPCAALVPTLDVPLTSPPSLRLLHPESEFDGRIAYGSTGAALTADNHYAVGSHWGAHLFSRGSSRFTDGLAHVEVPAAIAVDPAREQRFVLIPDAVLDPALGMRLLANASAGSGGVLHLQFVVFPSTIIADVVYDGVQHRWWRLRQDAGTAQLIAETAPTAGGPWTTLGVTAGAIDCTSMSLELAVVNNGTGTPATPTDTGYFRHLHAEGMDHL